MLYALAANTYATRTFPEMGRAAREYNGIDGFTAKDIVSVPSRYAHINVPGAPPLADASIAIHMTRYGSTGSATVSQMSPAVAASKVVSGDRNVTFDGVTWLVGSVTPAFSVTRASSGPPA